MKADAHQILHWSSIAFQPFQEEIASKSVNLDDHHDEAFIMVSPR